MRQGDFAARFNVQPGRTRPDKPARARLTVWHIVDGIAPTLILTYCGKTMRLKARYGHMEFAASDGSYATADPDQCDPCAAAMLERGHAQREPGERGVRQGVIRSTRPA